MSTTVTLWTRPRAALLGVRPVTPAIRCRPTLLSPLAWLALQALALWPHGLWLARRTQDGSDLPLGLAALAALALWLARQAATLRIVPDRRWLAAALGLGAVANLSLWWLPPLAAALLAALALAAAGQAWLPARTPRGAPLLLLLLALPWIATLQYFAGYPLRVLTAEASAVLLRLAGIAAERSGSTMTVDGALVIVDAPCSGVQMAWLAYFCAAAVAAFAGLRDRALLARLPLVGMLVLAGNVLRNTWLVALEARPQGLDASTHEAIGLALLALVCAAVVMLTKGGRRESLV